ncbi:serine hydrolase (plasmid) [Coraliomargarita sp. W4R53]
MDASRLALLATHRPRLRTRTAATLATAALAVGLLAGCSAAPPATPTTSASAVAQVVELPDTVLGGQARWVLDAINGGIDDPAAEATKLLSPALLEQISAEDLATVFTQLEPQSPWVPTAVEDGGDSALITITPASGDALDMQIAIDADGLIAGLLFSASTGDREPAASWSELEDAVDGFAAETTLTVTDVTDGASERIAAAGGGSDLGDTDAMPSGSMFKLYVLGAVATAVADGSLTWDAPLIVTDDVKSLPSGELQNESSGTTVTVQEAAEQMIAISDNTATDMLMAAVGPEALEQALVDLGHHDPSLNTPMLSTRALFQLGWGEGGDGGDARADWNAATTTAEQRQVIDALPTGLLDIPVSAVVTPVWQDRLDWFTTPDDLAAAHLALQTMATTEAGAPIRGILSANNGLGETGDEWPYVAFKAGSSIGVLGGSWYLERADGRAFVITIQGSSDDPSELADQATFFGQVSDAVALLEQE